MLGRICKADFCTYGELISWRYDWSQIWEMIDMLDVQDWVEWQQQGLLEQIRQQAPR